MKGDSGFYKRRRGTLQVWFVESGARVGRRVLVPVSELQKMFSPGAVSSLVGLAVPDEAVARVAELLAERPDDFVRRTRHLLGPLDIVIQESPLDTGDPIAVQSFPLWRSVPPAKARALALIIAEILFVAGHPGVAVALVDSQGKGLSFRITTFDADFVCREIISQFPNGEAAA